MARRKRKYGSAGATKVDGPAAKGYSNSSGSGKTAPTEAESKPDSISEHAEAVKKWNEKHTMPEKAPGARSANNDPEWYAKDQQMLIDVASIPFSEPLGGELDLTTPNEMFMVASDNNTQPGVVAVTSPNDATIPGIMTLKTKSSFGISRDIRDPINVCATALYAHVRVVNNGRKNYDAPDLFLYCASMADVYSYVMWIVRVYAKAFLASSRNRYIGKALLESENIDPDDVLNNLANFRYWINSYIAKVAAYAVPSDIAYFQRRAWMYAHMYIENPDMNIKDQLYQFSPDGFFHFELDSSGAGCLIYKTIPSIVGHSNKLKVADLRAIGEWLMQNVTNDEDFGLMSGDILKAFNGNIIGLPSIPEQVELVPVYSEYVLLQMKNATVCGTCRDGTALQYDTLSTGVNLLTGNVYQDTKGLLQSIEGLPFAYSNQRIDADVVGVQMKHVLSVNTPTPSPIDVMEITRLTACGKGVVNMPGTNNVPVVKVASGADIVVEVRVTQFTSGVIDNTAYIASHLYDYSSWTGALFATLRRFMKFKFSPLIYGANFTGTGVAADPRKVDYVELMSEVDNYTIIAWDQLSRIHEVAMLSMFWVPGIAKLVNF